MRAPAVACLLAGAVLAGACDGDDDPGSFGARFTAADSTPGTATLSLAPGAVSGRTFEIQVLVTGIDMFFGAAFRVQFDSRSAAFRGFSANGSFLEATGVTTDFRAAPHPTEAGVVLVSATRQGQFAGVDVTSTRRLIALSFEATSPTSANVFGFGPPATREVVTCPTPPAACTTLADATLTWSGGTLVAD